MYIHRDPNPRRKATGFAKWGTGPAVPLPAYIVDALGIKEGDSIETTLSTNVICRVAQTRPRRVAKATSELSRRLQADIKLGRDEANTW